MLTGSWEDGRHRRLWQPALQRVRPRGPALWADTHRNLRPGQKRHRCHFRRGRREGEAEEYLVDRVGTDKGLRCYLRSLDKLEEVF